MEFETNDELEEKNSHARSETEEREKAARPIFPSLIHRRPSDFSYDNMINGSIASLVALNYLIKLMSLPEHEGDERDCDDEQIEQVESRPAEGARVEDEAIRYDLQAHLHGEDRREEVVEVVQDLEWYR